MPTITDTLLRANGSALTHQRIAFVPRATTSGTYGGVSVSAVTAITDASGEFTVSLKPGRYWARWRTIGSPVSPIDELPIGVPDDAATYQLVDLIEVSTPESYPNSGWVEFATVALMLASDTTRWRFARLRNYEGADGVQSLWMRTGQPLADNGADIRQAADGSILQRYWTNP